MPITRTNMIDDDGSGTTGTILNNAWKQELYGQIDGVVEPAPVTIPHSALIFNGGLVVTAAQLTLCDYVRHGRDVHLRIVITAATVTAGASASIGIGGLPFTLANGPSLMTITSLAAAGWGTCMTAPQAGGNSVALNRFDFATWPASAGGAYFYADLFLRLA